VRGRVAPALAGELRSVAAAWAETVATAALEPAEPLAG